MGNNKISRDDAKLVVLFLDSLIKTSRRGFDTIQLKSVVDITTVDLKLYERDSNPYFQFEYRRIGEESDGIKTGEILLPIFDNFYLELVYEIRGIEHVEDRAKKFVNKFENKRLNIGEIEYNLTKDSRINSKKIRSVMKYLIRAFETSME